MDARRESVRPANVNATVRPYGFDRNAVMASDGPCRRRRRSGGGGRSVRLTVWYFRPTTLTVAVGSLDGEATKLMSALASRLAAANAPVRLKLVETTQRAGGGRHVFVEQDRSRRRARRCRRPVAGAGHYCPRTRRRIACCAPGILDRRHRRLEAPHRRRGRRRNEPEGRQRPDGGVRSWPRQCDRSATSRPRRRGARSKPRRCAQF